MTSQIFVTALEEAKDQDITVRINCDGGEVECGWAMIAKFAEHKGKKYVKVDAKAHSMGALFLCYADEVECLDVAEFLIHRASYPQWFEGSEYFTDAIKGNLERMNQKLRAAFEAKVDVEKFEKLKGVKVKDVFSMENRIDVFLTSAEAKKIGLVDTITKITPSKRAEIDAYAVKIAAKYKAPAAGPEETEEKTNPKNEPIMTTVAEFKAKHPDLHALVVAEAKKTEKDRITALLVYNEVDPEAVKKAIKEDVEPTLTMMAEMSLKVSSGKALETAGAESKEKGKTDTGAAAEGAVDEKAKAAADFLASVKKKLTPKK